MKNYFLIIATLLTTISLIGQSDNRVLDAYAVGDVAAFKQLIETAEREGASKLDIAKLQYAAFGAYQKDKNNEGAQQNVNAAEANLDAYLAANPSSADAHALLSGVYGLQIGLSPMKGMTLGSKSSKLTDKALQLDSKSGLAHYLKGSSLYFTPRMWGGNVPKAIEHLQRAKQIYEANEATATWEYLAVLAVLGQAYHYQEALPEAKKAYDAALTIAPNYGWVKYQLLPELEKDLK